VVLDKVDLLQAMDFKDELTEIGSSLTDLINGKVIFTTNVKDDKDQGIDEQNDFTEIKASLMGTEKALIIRMNDDETGRDKTAFEGIAHLFAFCKSTLDKYIISFNLLKLAILEGKTVILVNDVTQAYRMKYFLAKFSLRSFVLGTDMPKA
jgi:superfamily II DNA/RNA helicase